MIRYQSTAALRAILFSFAFFFCGMLSAQNLQEVVYLKNGSIIRGIIIEQIPEKSLKIQTADGSIFAYDMKEVQKITKEPPSGKRGPLAHRLPAPLSVQHLPTSITAAVQRKATKVS